MKCFDVSIHACLDTKGHITIWTLVRFHLLVNRFDVSTETVWIGELSLADVAVDDRLDVAVANVDG